ncbi:MAG: hypothetical protein ACREFP_00485 [Acetobacteraceae bacterium]
MASFAPIAGGPIAGLPGGAAPTGPTLEARGRGGSALRLAMTGVGKITGRSLGGAIGRLGHRPASVLTWWASRRQRSYLGR